MFIFNHTMTVKRQQRMLTDPFPLSTSSCRTSAASPALDVSRTQPPARASLPASATAVWWSSWPVLRGTHALHIMPSKGNCPPSTYYLPGVGGVYMCWQASADHEDETRLRDGRVTDRCRTWPSYVASSAHLACPQRKKRDISLSQPLYLFGVLLIFSLVYSLINP